MSEERAYARVTLRLLPFLGLCYLVAYLDRVNVGFAKLHMLADIGMSEAAYGFGAGIFFIGYFLFEVPSNLVLHRVGARIWIARIMVTWGLISGAMAFVEPLARATGLEVNTVFYILRFLLGAAEAGFFPGVLLYLNYWYPAHRQSRTIALLLVAQPFAFVFGAPLSGAIMESFGGVKGLHDWQWMFVLEAIPAVLLGFVVLAFLDNRIEDAKWLTEEEKKLLRARLDGEARRKRDTPLRELFAIPAMLTGVGVAAGLAAINSFGNLGGFVGPYLLGLVTEWLGSRTAGVSVLGGFMVVAGVLIALGCGRYGLRQPQQLP